MAVVKTTTVQTFLALAADTKPTSGVPAGSRCWETDTGLWFQYDGTAWTPEVFTVQSWTPGASEPKSARKQTVGPSTTRVTVITPASGKRIRIISVLGRNAIATGVRVEVYFGTGANITTNAGKEIFEPLLHLDNLPTHSMAWSDNSGRVGDVDEVVSLRTGADITNNVGIIIQYREED